MASKIFLNIEQGRNSDRAMTKLIIIIPPAFVSILSQKRDYDQNSGIGKFIGKALC